MKDLALLLFAAVVISVAAWAGPRIEDIQRRKRR
jgi:hypothetical protein